jgi:hypothetical protein
MSNAIWLIHPYKLGSTWVFDDPRFKLAQEPFVGMTNTVIDSFVSKAGLSIYGQFTCMFSAGYFPDADVRFERRETLEGKSAFYWCDELGVEFWLCPVLNYYFSTLPETIYVKVLPYQGG